MQLLASKFIYFKDLRNNNLKPILKPFQNLSIQLSFFKKEEFFKIDHRFLKETCDNLKIDIPTVHAPTVDIFDKEFLDVIGLIKEIYKIKLISIHPQRGQLNLSLAKLEEYSKSIQDLEIILAYENFPSKVGKRKWIYLPHKMYSCFNLPFLKLTFDTSHLDTPSDCIQELSRVFDKVVLIHLSDTDKGMQHLPLGRGSIPYQEFIAYLKNRKFSGSLILEYMPEYEDQLIEDIKRLRKNL